VWDEVEVVSVWEVSVAAVVAVAVKIKEAQIFAWRV
jgi:hypothetical protein